MIVKLKLDQRLGVTELKDLQNKKLRALIKHSYDHVPYYHSLFKRVKLTPDDVKTVDDMYKVPISKKADITDLPIRYLTANNVDLSECNVPRTSGTSGIPLAVYRHKKMQLSIDLRHYSYQLNCSEKITNRRVIIGGAWMRPPPPKIQKLGIFRTKKISPFDHPKKQLKEIAENDTRTLIGHQSCVLALAKEIKESDFREINLSLIFTAGELLQESNRNFITRTFGAKLFDTYGATEIGRISGECREHHYHVDSSVIVEVTRDGETLSAGEEGEITGTSLINYAMPFIRFNLEDFGMTFDEACSCGSHFPLMKLTSGRVTDLIHLPGGGAISAHEANYFLPLIPTIKQYQVIQETTNRLTVKLVKGRNFEESTISNIKHMFSKILGDGIEVSVLVVEDIPREKSGKFKLFKTTISAM